MYVLVCAICSTLAMADYAYEAVEHFMQMRSIVCSRLVRADLNVGQPDAHPGHSWLSNAARSVLIDVAAGVVEEYVRT